MAQSPNRTPLAHRCAAVAAVLSALIVGSGCGSTVNRTAATGFTTSAITSAVPPAAPTGSTSTEASANTRRVTFLVTTKEGWTYSGAFPFPRRTVLFGTDVSSSPPGHAKLLMTPAGGEFQQEEVHDSNPGRPNGPILSVGVRSVIYPLGPAGAGESQEEFHEPCELVHLFGIELNCPLNLSGGDGPEMRESDIRRMVATLQHQEPWYSMEFNLSPQGPGVGLDNCAVYLSAHGEVRYNPERTKAACLTTRVAVASTTKTGGYPRSVNFSALGGRTVLPGCRFGPAENIGLERVILRCSDLGSQSAGFVSRRTDSSVGPYECGPDKEGSYAGKLWHCMAHADSIEIESYAWSKQDAERRYAAMVKVADAHP
jgi:hypothetical protein